MKVEKQQSSITYSTSVNAYEYLHSLNIKAHCIRVHCVCTYLTPHAVQHIPDSLKLKGNCTATHTCPQGPPWHINQRGIVPKESGIVPKRQESALFQNSIEILHEIDIRMHRYATQPGASCGSFYASTNAARIIQTPSSKFWITKGVHLDEKCMKRERNGSFCSGRCSCLDPQ